MMIQTEYIALATMSFLFLLAFFPVSVGKAQAFGAEWLGSNRKPIPGKELPEWAARCDRAHNNLKDNFPGFIAAVLLLGLTSKFDQGTAIASWIYVGSRVLHYVSYGVGIVPLRALFYFGGLFSNFYLLIKVML